MTTKGQVEGVLAELGRKIDVLIEETKNSTGEVRESVEKKIQDLKKKRDKIENDLNAYKEKNEDKWDDAKGHLSTALAELKKAVESLFSERKG